MNFLADKLRGEAKAGYATVEGQMASKRNVRRKACTRKIRYRTIEEARVAQRFTTRTKGGIVDVYWCQFCGGVHVGHARHVDKWAK